MADHLGEAVTNLIGRAWEASVALEGHGIEPEIRERLDEAMKRVQTAQKGPPEDQSPEDREDGGLGEAVENLACEYERLGWIAAADRLRSAGFATAAATQQQPEEDVEQMHSDR